MIEETRLFLFALGALILGAVVAFAWAGYRLLKSLSKFIDDDY